MGFKDVCRSVLKGLSDPARRPLLEIKIYTPMGAVLVGAALVVGTYHLVRWVLPLLLEVYLK